MMFHIVLKTYMVKLKTNFNAFRGHISIEGALRRPSTYDGHTSTEPLNELIKPYMISGRHPIN